MGTSAAPRKVKHHVITLCWHGLAGKVCIFGMLSGTGIVSSGMRRRRNRRLRRRRLCGVERAPGDS